MPIAEIDGIPTRYEVIGDGPPVLMYAPGGFDATIEKWSDQSVYAKIRLLDALPKQFRCIVFDRRECGASGGRVEAVTWRHYVAQGRGLMDHLGIARAHLIGGCMGVCPVVAFATEHPERVASMVLYWPVGGAKYRINGQLRFVRHLAYLEEHGLKGVVALAQASADSFGRDPRGGPWRGVIHRDRTFADAVAGMDPERYRLAVMGMQHALNDRDTAPGAEPEAMLCCDVPALIVPGADASHATSAARYLGECLPRADYWDVPVAGQTAEAVQPRVLEFLSRHG